MTAAELLAVVRARFPDILEIPKAQGHVRGDELYVSVSPARLVEALRFLRDDEGLSFDFLSFLTAIDWKSYFEVVYYLVSSRSRHKLVVKAKLDDRDAPEIESVTALWPTADWQEREVFDLMGIRFRGHYNLRRLLLPEDWDGYPLRKDYAAKPDRYD